MSTLPLPSLHPRHKKRWFSLLDKTYPSLLSVLQGCAVNTQDCDIEDVAQALLFGALTFTVWSRRWERDDFTKWMQLWSRLPVALEPAIVKCVEREQAGLCEVLFSCVEEAHALLLECPEDAGDWREVFFAWMGLFPVFVERCKPSMRRQKGAFYTPYSLASYMVTSLHQQLRDVCGYPLGLAATKPVMVEENARPLRLFDVSVGTGAFWIAALFTCHDVLHAYWREDGRSVEAQREQWQTFVKEDLPRRLCGVELMLGAYLLCPIMLTVVLMHLGIDEESTYQLPWQLIRGNTLLSDTPEAVDVLMGNPPYAIRSGTSLDVHCPMWEAYKHEVKEERNKQPLCDDYIRFLAFAHRQSMAGERCCVSLVTNHTFLRGYLHRGVRRLLLRDMKHIQLLDLHGNVRLAEKTPKGCVDENVFGIQQGVAVIHWLYERGAEGCTTEFSELWGTKEEKSKTLREGGWEVLPLRPEGPSYYFAPQPAVVPAVYQTARPLDDILLKACTGLFTGNDALLLASSKESMRERLSVLSDMTIDREEIFDILKCARRGKWPSQRARERLHEEGVVEERLCQIAYRPFVPRWTYLNRLLQRPRLEGMSPLLRPNLALLVSRWCKGEQPAHVFVSRQPVEKIFLSSKTSNNVFVFPLYEDSGGTNARRTSLFGASWREQCLTQTALRWLPYGCGDLEETVGPEDLFHFIYAQLFDPLYRATYSAALRMDFPRLFLPDGLESFAKMSQYGADLVALHLMEQDYPAASWNRHERPLKRGWSCCESVSNGSKDMWDVQALSFVDVGGLEITKIGGKKHALQEVIDGRGRVYINKASYLDGVDEGVWDHYIGGYQVCAHWLKMQKRDKGSFDERAQQSFMRIHEVLRQTRVLMEKIAFFNAAA
ncbi:MAG: hypothetical protein CL920_11625 [Deltaproteobacteria bacterium]|nr:hypothetical protein [Deltaproteobacteria bacterium]|tara:strand:+ start:15540 stop:18197 length:2658 start_codon:yes stop_codon:yes gene_type:complete